MQNIVLYFLMILRWIVTVEMFCEIHPSKEVNELNVLMFTKHWYCHSETKTHSPLMCDDVINLIVKKYLRELKAVYIVKWPSCRFFCGIYCCETWFSMLYFITRVNDRLGSSASVCQKYQCETLNRFGRFLLCWRLLRPDGKLVFLLSVSG